MEAPASCAIRTARFPLVVYLAGGSGGAITRQQLAYVRKLTGDEDCVATIMPLFKRTHDAEELGGVDNIGAYDDYPLMARCYRTMLRTLFTAIPNIDPECSAFGGFSNGAHVTEMLVSAVDPFILKHFGGFYLLDGGVHHYQPLQDRRAQKTFCVFHWRVPSGEVAAASAGVSGCRVQKTPEYLDGEDVRRRACIP
jgi:hypothetical protein